MQKKKHSSKTSKSHFPGATSGQSLSKKARKSRNSCRMCGGGAGTEGMTVNLATDRHPGTNTKRSRIALAVTSISLSLGHFGTQLLERPAQFLVESPGTLTRGVMFLQLFIEPFHEGK